MPILTAPISEVQLPDPAALNNWIDTTQKSLHRLPINGLLEHGAEFHDDEYIGDGDVLLRFNEHGFQAFCQKIGFRYDQLELIETPSLASTVLNDLVRQSGVRSRLDKEEFVIDQDTNTIIGIVSNSYVGYSNNQFLKDIESFLENLPRDQQLNLSPPEDDFQFHEAYGINTELTIRYIFPRIKHGKFQSRSGTVEDASKFGLEFKNSMVGTSSVRINYFLYRLVCSNGMMVPAASSTNRVFHSGHRYTFKSRLDSCFKEVYRKIEGLADILKTLGAINFDPLKLARDNSVNSRLFDIIPSMKQTICDAERMYLRYPQEISEADKLKMKIEHDSEVIRCIPRYFGGEHSKRVFNSRIRDNVTIFDFLNVFTEHAKTCKPARKLEIEEKTGILSKYISENAKKFM